LTFILCRSILEELLRVLDYPKFKFPKTHKIAFIQDLLRIANLAEPETVPDVVAAELYSVFWKRAR